MNFCNYRLMNYRVKEVEALDDFILLLTFETGERKTYDMKPHLNGGVFEELKDKAVFKNVRVSFDTVEWENGADIDPETLYEDGQLEEMQAEGNTSL